MKEKNKNIPANDPQRIEEDEATIFAETAHIRDRDEIMLDGNRTVQGGPSTDIDDEWEPADGEKLSGLSDQSPETVDAQYEQLGRINEKIRSSRDHRDPTLAKPTGPDDDYETLSDEDLMKYADVLGIPDRQRLPRMKLIGLIRDQERHGL